MKKAAVAFQAAKASGAAAPISVVLLVAVTSFACVPLVVVMLIVVLLVVMLIVVVLLVAMRTAVVLLLVMRIVAVVPLLVMPIAAVVFVPVVTFLSIYLDGHLLPVARVPAAVLLIDAAALVAVMRRLALHLFHFQNTMGE